jgi:hypothetical protein
MARKADSYRAARRNAARKLGLLSEWIGPPREVRLRLVRPPVRLNRSRHWPRIQTYGANAR